MRQTHENVACTACGCVCDDIRVTTDAGRVVAAENACETLGRPWFLNQMSHAGPDVWLDGQPAAFATAVARTAALLAAAKAPLIYGLSHSSTEAQRAAVALAERTGAVIDTTASTGHAPSILALQQVGESACTLGEVKQRADLVIFWGCDPETTHPRHRERYAPPRPGRVTVVVDDVESDTSRAADQFVRVTPGCHWEALAKVRLMIRKPNPPAFFPPREGGEESVPPSLGGKGVRGLGSSEQTPNPPAPFPKREGGDDLAARMRACRFGIVFFGAGLTRGAMAHRAVEELLRLVTELNDGRRFYARRMRRTGDVAGADSVLAWQTGYPFGVDFSRGYPRYNPGEFTGPERLSRGEADVCVLVGGTVAKDFPLPALDRLNRIPVVVLDSPGDPTVVPAAVRFTTAVYGVHRPGTAYRMDEVPIPLRPLLPTTLRSDAEILNAILASL